MLGKYLDDYIARETNRNLNIQGPTLRATASLPTILITLPSTNSWICPCGATFAFGPDITIIPHPQQLWKPAPARVESYVEFTLRSAHKPQRHDFNITLTRTHAGRLRSDDIETLTTPWIMDESFFQHLVQNPLHASAFAHELDRNGTFIKLIHHSGLKDPNARRLVVRYAGPSPASNILIQGQRWKFRHTKAPWHPLTIICFIWMALICLGAVLLWAAGTRRVRTREGEVIITRIMPIWVVILFFALSLPSVPLTYIMLRVTRLGRSIR